VAPARTLSPRARLLRWGLVATLPAAALSFRFPESAEKVGVIVLGCLCVIVVWVILVLLTLFLILSALLLLGEIVFDIGRLIIIPVASQLRVSLPRLINGILLVMATKRCCASKIGPSLQCGIWDREIDGP
jgi:hypothetical protein